MANRRATTAVLKSRSEHALVRAGGRTSVSERAACALHNCASHAHLWRQASHRNPHLCRTKSTFPPMTTGTISCILEPDQAEGVAPACRRKGRKHEINTVRMDANGSGRGAALRLLWCIPRAGAQSEPVVAAGVPAAARHQHRAELVPVLPPAPTGPSHRSRCQYAYLRTPWAIKSSHRPTSNQIIVESREGQRQASRLPCPSLQEGTHGRRD
jgi:hypothetical protein